MSKIFGEDISKSGKRAFLKGAATIFNFHGPRRTIKPLSDEEARIVNEQALLSDREAIQQDICDAQAKSGRPGNPIR